MDPPSPSFRSTTSSGVSQTNGDFITVGEALKLIPPFKGNKQEVQMRKMGMVSQNTTVILGGAFFYLG
jgi:hypothetical protein